LLAVMSDMTCFYTSKCSQTHNLLMMMGVRCTTNDEKSKMSTEITDI
jgi:hypothetical protein